MLKDFTVLRINFSLPVFCPPDQKESKKEKAGRSTPVSSTGPAPVKGDTPHRLIISHFYPLRSDFKSTSGTG